MNEITNIATDCPDVNANDYVMAMEMANTLHQHYPGHLWAVTCEGDRGIATVRNLGLDGNWGFILKLSDLSTASDWKKRVQMAGGEVLERFRLSRRGFRADEYSSLKVNFAGKFIADK